MKTEIKKEIFAFVKRDWIYIAIFAATLIITGIVFRIQSSADNTKELSGIIKAIYAEKQMVIDSLTKQNKLLKSKIDTLTWRKNVITKEIVYIKQKQNGIIKTTSQKIADVDTFGSESIIRYFSNKSSGKN